MDDHFITNRQYSVFTHITECGEIWQWDFEQKLNFKRHSPYADLWTEPELRKTAASSPFAGVYDTLELILLVSINLIPAAWRRYFAR